MWSWINFVRPLVSSQSRVHKLEQLAVIVEDDVHIERDGTKLAEVSLEWRPD